MKHNIILLIVCMFMVMGFASALEETIGIQKLNTDVHLIQNCINSTYANITRLIAPNNSFIINSQIAMTKTGDNYNYTYKPIIEGRYVVYGICNENGVYTTWAYHFEVTPTGKELTTSQSFIYLILLTLLLLLFSFVLYWTFELPWTNEVNNDKRVLRVEWKKYLKLVLGGISYFLFVGILNLSFVISSAFLSGSPITSFLRAIFKLSYIFIFPIIILTIVIGIINFVNDQKITSYLTRGVLPKIEK